MMNTSTAKTSRQKSELWLLQRHVLCNLPAGGEAGVAGRQPGLAANLLHPLLQQLHGVRLATKPAGSWEGPGGGTMVCWPERRLGLWKQAAAAAATAAATYLTSRVHRAMNAAQTRMERHRAGRPRSEGLC